MKSSSPKRRVRPLHARVAVANPSEFDDYGPEPNMKLSHAFMVVLALHVIAVGGLFAFNKVKATHSTASVKIKTESTLAKEVVASTVVPEAVSLPAHETKKVVAKVMPAHQPAPAVVTMRSALSEIKAKAPMVALAAPVAEAPATQIPSGGTENPSTPPDVSSSAIAAPTPEPAPAAVVATKEYTIVKGDNPYKVAKRFHVSYDSLMKLNNITDPRKIQIGQKLKIPAAAPRKTVRSQG